MTFLLLSVLVLMPDPARPCFDPAIVVDQVRQARAGVELPAAGDGTEFLLDTNYVVTRACWQQSYPAVAFSGEVYLVAWEDHRGYFQDDVYAARVSVDGVLLDSTGICVSAEPVNQQRPAVAFDGANFLVVWQDSRNNESDIYAARVSPAGAVLDPHGIAVSRATGGELYPDVALLDTLCLVVWQDARGGSYYDLYGARVTRSGSVLEPQGFVISAGTAHREYPAVASGVEAWLVAWQDERSGERDIYAARVTADGAVADTAGIALGVAAGDQLSPAVAFDSIWLVAWNDRRGSYGDVYAGRVSADGVALDPGGFAVVTAGNEQSSPAVRSDGEHFLVAWDDARSYPDYNLYAARVTRAGAVLEPDGFLVSGADATQAGATVAAGGPGWFVAWYDGRGGQTWSIFGARVSSAGAVIDTAGRMLSPTVYGQYDTDVAFDGENYFVVWSDFRSGASKDIFGCRVTPRGRVLDPQGIALCSLDNWQGVPAVAFGDSNFLVVWSDLRTGDFDIFGTRVSRDGAVLDPPGIAVCSRAQIQVFPDVAWNGANWLVAWHDFWRHQYDIYAARVGSDGKVMDTTAIGVSLASSGQYYPAVACSDTAALVLWHDARVSTYRTYCARVLQKGTVLDPDGIMVSSSSSMNPDAAFDGENYFAVWDDYRAGGADIYGARIGQDGTILDPNGRQVSTATNYQTTAAVAFNGSEYVVAWQDWRNGHDYDIHGCRVRTDGTAGPDFVVHADDQEQITPAVAAGPGGQAMFVDCGWVDSLTGRPANTYRIWGWLDPAAAVRESFKPQASSPKPGPTIVRGVLYLGVDSRQHSAYRAGLLDAAGRKVLDLKSGANDVSRLAPGVYFVRSPLVNRHSSITKVVVAR